METIYVLSAARNSKYYIMRDVTCCNTAELECGLTTNSFPVVNAVELDDIKVELSLYCSCRFGLEVVSLVIRIIRE